MWRHLPIMDQFWPETVNKSTAPPLLNGSKDWMWNSSQDRNDTELHWDDKNSVDTFETWVKFINKFGMPVIIFGGLIGNSLSFTVFVTSHLKLQSCSIYLAFLNVVDSLFLLCLFTQWLGWFGIFLFHMQGWCQIIIYCSYVSSFLSAWGVVCFTIERFIVVYYPLHKQVLCTRHKAIVTVVSVSLVALAFYSFSLFIHGMVYYENFDTHLCTTFPGYDGVIRIMTAVDTVLTLIIPSVTIVLINIAIAKQIWQFMLIQRLESSTSTLVTDPDEPKDEPKEPLKTTKANSSLQRSSNRSSLSKTMSRPQSFMIHHQGGHDSRRALKYRTTRSLLIVSSVFVLLNLPAHCLRIHMVIHYLLHTDNPDTAYLQKWINVLQFLSYLNYSANFLLYCACSYGFRTGLRRIFTRLRRSYERSKLSMINMIPRRSDEAKRANEALKEPKQDPVPKEHKRIKNVTEV